MNHMSKRQQRKTSPNKFSHRSNKANQRNKGNTNHLRIIAGQWRGRKLSFATAPSLRPTPDRVRETLFNWLQGYFHEARCLDLFAGSGALGFEALSRGVEQVTLVENNPQAITKLQENIQLLSVNNAELIATDAFQFLATNPQPFDLIFLDPPFRKGFLPRVLSIICEQELLTNNGLIYLEHEKEEDLALILDQFEMVKEKQAGQLTSILMKEHSI